MNHYSEERRREHQRERDYENRSLAYREEMDRKDQEWRKNNPWVEKVETAMILGSGIFCIIVIGLQYAIENPTIATMVVLPFGSIWYKWGLRQTLLFIASIALLVRACLKIKFCSSFHSV